MGSAGHLGLSQILHGRNLAVECDEKGRQLPEQNLRALTLYRRRIS